MSAGPCRPSEAATTNCQRINGLAASAPPNGNSHPCQPINKSGSCGCFELRRSCFFSLSSPEGGEGRGEEVDDFLVQSPHPDPLPALAGRGNKNSVVAAPIVVVGLRQSCPVGTSRCDVRTAQRAVPTITPALGRGPGPASLCACACWACPRWCVRRSIHCRTPSSCF